MLVGITGKIGAGKSTLATQLVRRGFTEYSFSQPLKQIACVLGFDDNQVFGTQEQKMEVNETWGISGREFMQKFGTSVCREFLPAVIPQMRGIWIKCFERFFHHNAGNVVVDDVRFVDEADAIKKLGGIIIRVVGPHEGDAHASEVSMDDYPADFVIHNKMDGLYWLYRQLSQIMKKYVPLAVHKANLNKNVLMDFIDHPVVRGDRYRLVRNPNITWEWLRNPIRVQWVDSVISGNAQNLPMDIIWRHPNTTRPGHPHKWDFGVLSHNPNITEEFVEMFIGEEWNWTYLSLRSFTIDFLRKHKAKPWRWEWLSANTKIGEEHLDEFPWDEDMLSANPSMYLHLTKNPDEICWHRMSGNEALTLEFVKANLDEDWDWAELSEHSVITPEFVEDNIKYQWKWDALANNININMDFVYAHPEVRWDWEALAFNPALVGKMPDTRDLAGAASENPGLTAEIAERNDIFVDMSCVAGNEFTKFFKMRQLLEKRFREAQEFVDGVQKILAWMPGSTGVVEYL